MIHRTTSAALVALLPLFAAGCTIDFDNYLSSGGGGVGGQGGGTTTSTTTTGGGGQGIGGTGGTGGGGCVPANCDDGNLCTTDTCNNGVCQYEAAVDPDLSSVDLSDDCRDPICVGTVLQVAGGADDDAEIPPDDGEICTQEVCSGGMAHPPEPSTHTCPTGKCNGNGVCVSCNDPSDCGALGSCIASFACTANACVPTYKPNTTKVSDDGTAGNCKATYCDGNGGMMTGNDNNDKPTPTDDCHDGICTAGAPSTPAKGDGSTCNDGGAEAGGQCKTGACVDCTNATGCTSPHVCLANNTCCTPITMAVACATAECGMVPDGCGGMISCPNTCATDPDGTGCLAGNVCGCTGGSNSPECTGNPIGDDCFSGKCGCNNDPDCTTSALPKCSNTTTNGLCVECVLDATCSANTKGKNCLPTFVCGCDADAPDCTGVGAGTCNTVTGVCNP